MPDTILVVDDEPNIRDLAALYLEKEGFHVLKASDGGEALEIANSVQPTLVVLDLMLPVIDGYEVCRRLRTEQNTPILMLTARDDDIDKIIGLEMGADDYMTKPFNPREMVARVRAILRRTQGDGISSDSNGEQRLIGNVEIDLAGRTVHVAGERRTLRAKEFDLLVTLVDHLNIVLSRDKLLDLVWGYEYYGQTRTVDVHVAHLREKLNGSELKIETVWGKGYKMVADA